MKTKKARITWGERELWKWSCKASWKWKNALPWLVPASYELISSTVGKHLQQERKKANVATEKEPKTPIKYLQIVSSCISASTNTVKLIYHAVMSPLNEINHNIAEKVPSNYIVVFIFLTKQKPCSPFILTLLTSNISVKYT